MSEYIKHNSLLIIEDSDDDFEVIEHSLRELDFDNPIIRCEDSGQFVNYMSVNNLYENEYQVLPGLILLDLNLPGVNGHRVLEIIMEDSNWKKIPVVVFSTSDNESDIERAYRSGASGYIKKPIDIDGFIGAIKGIKKFWFEMC